MKKLFARTHEWIEQIKEDIFILGISEHAQDALGDVVFLEMEASDKDFAKGEEIGVIESVKAASGLFAPVSGKIIEVNEELIDAPELVNEDCYGKGWICKISSPEANKLNDLLSESAYLQFVKEN